MSKLNDNVNSFKDLINLKKKQKDIEYNEDLENGLSDNDEDDEGNTLPFKYRFLIVKNQAESLIKKKAPIGIYTVIVSIILISVVFYYLYSTLSENSYFYEKRDRAVSALQDKLSEKDTLKKQLRLLQSNNQLRLDKILSKASVEPRVRKWFQYFNSMETLFTFNLTTISIMNDKSYFNKINVLVEIAPIEEETSSKELKEFMFIAQEFIQLSLHPYRKIVKGIPEQGILSFSFVEE
ncbi:MAG: hypothetical protein HOG49_20020 [Candidatus Scalindua sp.]|nr:hypothetical protein [Candidatus Scalindua sp.]